MTPENKRKSEFEFNEHQLGFIAACIIGDGCLTNTGRLVIAHGLQQKDYCEWKAQRLSEIIGQEVKSYPTRQCVQVQVQRKGLKKLWFIAYKDKVKQLHCLLQYIKNVREAIAIWICDDGNVTPSINTKNGKCYSEAIQIFTFTDLEMTIILADWFESSVGIRPKLMFKDRSKQNKKSAYILKFTASDSRKLYSIIKDFIPNIPSMDYKFRYLKNRI